jgi:zinc finger protein
MSFYCSHCHFKNTEIQSAGEINKHGVKFLLKMDQSVDLERQIVKGDTAIFRIEELDLEIPPGRGRLSNVEGILQTVAGDLGKDQAQRKADHPELYEKISTVISSIAMIIARQRFPCTITLDDPAGNSWIEPSTQDGTSKYVRTEYPRSVQQNEALGLSGSIPTEVDASVEVQIGMEGLDILDGTTASHQVPCPGCGKDAFLNIQLVSIPYFKEVYITAVVCEQCGYRMNDVKTGGEIPDKGQRIWLDVHGPADLRRDILKSETCSLKIPECNVEVQPGTMGGRFTTVEGLLTQVRDDLRGSIFDMDDVNSTGGDSMPTQRKIAWTNFFADLEKAIRGDMRYTIIMEDPLGNSYVQSATAPMPDPQIRTESYHRTEEEEEDLGLLDMRTFQNADGDYVKDPGQDPAQNSEGIFDIEHPKS